MEKSSKPAAEWQALIASLSGVYAAHVVFSDRQEPLEIHVLADSGRNTKAIVRDVQSALSARFGVEIDYRIISVAQISPRLFAGMSCRLAYDGIDVHATSVAVEVTVALSKDGVKHAGTASGSMLQFSRLRCIAQATLEAVKSCTGGTSFFEFANAEIVRLGGRPIVVTQIYCIPDATPLIGCVCAEPNADAAVAQSVLDAINRKLELFTRES